MITKAITTTTSTEEYELKHHEGRGVPYTLRRMNAGQTCVAQPFSLDALTALRDAMTELLEATK